MKKTIVSFLLLSVLLRTVFVPVYASSPEEEAPRITTTMVDKKTGEVLPYNLQMQIVEITEDGSTSYTISFTASA